MRNFFAAVFLSATPFFTPLWAYAGGAASEESLPKDFDSRESFGKAIRGSSLMRKEKPPSDVSVASSEAVAPEGASLTVGRPLVPPFLGGFQFSLDVSGMAFDQQAVYASFGYEKQIFMIDKVVLGVARILSPAWKGTIQWAPVYNSIRYDPRYHTGQSPSDSCQNYTYSQVQTPFGPKEICGRTPWRDWYKNLGNRVYFLGDMPFLEMKVVYTKEGERFYNRIEIGRQKTFSSFTDKQMIWGDDGAFAPYAWWLSKDILSGLSMEWGSKEGTGFKVGIFSGDGNPLKGGWYNQGLGDPNLKSNNTPTTSLRIEKVFSARRAKLSLFYSLSDGPLGSSYREDAAVGGKHNNTLYALGFLWKFPFQKSPSQGFTRVDGDLDNTPEEDGLSLFGQKIRYVGGLRAQGHQKSLQSTYPNIKDIVQRGYFAGMRLKAHRFDGGFTYEAMDRFDYAAWLWSTGNEPSPPPPPPPPTSPPTFPSTDELRPRFGKALQRSRIIWLRFETAPFLHIDIAYHHISNPLWWISDIDKTHGDDRYRIGISFHW